MNEKKSVNKIIVAVAKAIGKDLNRPLKADEKLTYGKLGDISDFTTDEEAESFENKLNFRNK